MKTLMTVLAGLLVAPVQDKPQSYFGGYGGGVGYLYRVTTEGGVTVEKPVSLGESTELVLGGGKENSSKIKIRLLEGMFGGTVYVIESEDRIQIMKLEKAGLHRHTKLVLVAEFLFSCQANYSFVTWEDGIPATIKCVRVGMEKVDTFEGRLRCQCPDDGHCGHHAGPQRVFECTKFTLGNDTYWLSKGVGIVKRVTHKGEVWTLRTVGWIK